MYRTALGTALLLAGLTSAGPALSDGMPSFIVPGSVDKTEYDGVPDANENGDDLLSAGLNSDGLQGPAPGFADPLNPTPAELRGLGVRFLVIAR